MVGAANSDSARISFFGSTKGELAHKLDKGQDAVGRRRLKCPPNRAKWSPITRLTNSAWGVGVPIIRRRRTPTIQRRPPTNLKDAATLRRKFFRFRKERARKILIDGPFILMNYYSPYKKYLSLAFSIFRKASLLFFKTTIFFCVLPLKELHPLLPMAILFFGLLELLLRQFKCRFEPL